MSLPKQVMAASHVKCKHIYICMQVAWWTVSFLSDKSSLQLRTFLLKNKMIHLKYIRKGNIFHWLTGDTMFQPVIGDSDFMSTILLILLYN
jgi:hypothetical protein